jgi:hypothetical protein
MKLITYDWRGKNSSDCLDEAKRRVYTDPASNRSWNLCWLVLSKIKTEYVFFFPFPPLFIFPLFLPLGGVFFFSLGLEKEYDKEQLADLEMLGNE